MSPSILLLGTFWLAQTQPASGQEGSLASVPAGYNLIAYDDAGVPERQPHLKTKPEQVHSFNTSEVEGDAKTRSVAWDHRKLQVHYDQLDPKVPYVLAITYANEAYNNRVQSIWAGGIQLQAAHALPKGKSERFIFRVPAEAIREGGLDLEFRLEAAVNVVVSIVELYAPLPSPNVLHLDEVSGLVGDTTGRVLDLACNPVAGAEITLCLDAARVLARAKSAEDGGFSLARKTYDTLPPTAELTLTATRAGVSTSRKLTAGDLRFEPVRYRPVPTRVLDSDDVQISLDGTWRICPKPSGDMRAQPLTDATWADWRVPGQWLQQGFEIPVDQTVAVGREFEIPKAWAGRRIFLRFDAIHAATQYWLNGTRLGASESLFTPVEWDITNAVRPGQVNRLDLEMKVNSVSELLSCSSTYAFHSLGGIDRAVRVFTLPEAHIESLHIGADLDKDYRDGQLRIDVKTTRPADVTCELFDADGGSVDRWDISSGSAATAPASAEVERSIANPRKWTAETPHLYRLVVQVRQGGTVVEQVERQIGFRKIEIRDRQMYVNGRRIKLAGVCRHEIDPLTGRADTMRHGAEDVRLLKNANLNYIRTSHYPPTQEFLDAADRIGMYVECEAPMCWVNDRWDMSQAGRVLGPTSAMIDYCHTHPSIIIWSLANESAFVPFFEASNALVKQLDPTRPTTFNFPDPKRICDIGNLHYPPMPYDSSVKGDPRPYLLGEYFFPVCHEQTDVRVNPGLRELWGFGHAEPDSAWGKAVAGVYSKSPYLTPGALPGAWSYMWHNDQLVGGAIWAAFDEPFYLPGGKQAGYNWVHGPWGLLDGWRRPKPEYYLAQYIFSPVWLTSRHFAFTPGQKLVQVPVENRYSFTDLGELKFTVEQNGQSQPVKARLPAGTSGQIELPVAPDTLPGTRLVLRVENARGESITAAEITVGTEPPIRLPEPTAGPVRVHQEDGLQIIEPDGLCLVLDPSTGTLRLRDARHRSALIGVPAPHLSRFDFGDLLNAPKYANLPEPATRVVKSAVITSNDQATTLRIDDRYDVFTGTTTWTIDRTGMSRVTIDYVYSGENIYARELGMRMLVSDACQTLKWHRWSEWGNVFPPEAICRTSGIAQAHRDSKWPGQPERVRPIWPWALDETELGTADFRGTKFNIYEASVTDEHGAGVQIISDGTQHVRACLGDKGVLLHAISQCWIAPVTLKAGDHLTGSWLVQLLPGR